jgi:hypothetical protein
MKNSTETNSTLLKSLERFNGLAIDDTNDLHQFEQDCMTFGNENLPEDFHFLQSPILTYEEPRTLYH